MRQYQYVDVGIEIGHYRNKDVDELTTRVKVMQSKTGYHAVPAKPKEMLLYTIELVVWIMEMLFI